MTFNYKQIGQLYVEAIEMTNDNVPKILESLKEKGIEHSLYTKDMSDNKHKHIHNTIFIKQFSSEYRLGYGMVLVMYEKGGILVIPKVDFNKRYDSVTMASNEAPVGMTPEEQQTLWGRRTW